MDVGFQIEQTFIHEGGAKSPFRPYGGSLFVVAKRNQKPSAPIMRPLRFATGFPRYGLAPGRTRCRPHPWGLSA
ncbi:protein of unknown function [Pseudomonas inefficax]|uniref:Uncharacterized protein n=1 Tax=Pseudomonas inefficax TaxID=2078786 RepID=A0AAQ1P7Y5_9PSED|nr:protein of unknown function [Pseudomonas inefficax]